MKPLSRMKSSAELEAGRRDGTHINYEVFDPEEYKGENEKRKPATLYVRRESFESAEGAKATALDLLQLIDHVRETADNLSSLVDALPVHDVAGKVLKTELEAQIHFLTEGSGG